VLFGDTQDTAKVAPIIPRGDHALDLSRLGVGARAKRGSSASHGSSNGNGLRKDSIRDCYEGVEGG
jgi:hypothetical protein